MCMCACVCLLWGDGQFSVHVRTRVYVAGRMHACSHALTESAGCTIWSGGSDGGGGLSYQDCASGDRRTAGTIA